jgi:carbamoyl-phosphate synthase large subunit
VVPILGDDAIMNVLITGVGGPAGINTLTLMPKNVNVFGGDCDPEAVDRINKAGLNLPTFYKIPKANEEGFLDMIKEIVTKHNIDLVIPTVDEELLIFSENPLETKVAISPFTTINMCNDKYLLYEKFDGYEFCPVYALAGSDKGVYGKIFVKPRIGRGGRNTAFFESEGNIPKDYMTNNFVVCEYLPGKEYTVDAMCDFDGNLIFAVPRIRTEVIKGISVKGKTEKNDNVLKITGEICKVLKFIGPINLQFKLDANSKPKLVEINPRFSGGLPLTAAAGINPVEVLLEAAQGNVDKDKLNWNEVEAENDVMRKLRL